MSKRKLLTILQKDLEQKVCKVAHLSEKKDFIQGLRFALFLIDSLKEYLGNEEIEKHFSQLRAADRRAYQQATGNELPSYRKLRF